MTKKWRCVKKLDGMCQIFWLGWLEYKIMMWRIQKNFNYLQRKEDGLKRAEAEIQRMNRKI